MAWWKSLLIVYVVGVVAYAVLQLVARRLAFRGDTRFTAFTNRAIVILALAWPYGTLVWFWTRVFRRVPPPNGW